MKYTLVTLKNGKFSTDVFDETNLVTEMKKLGFPFENFNYNKFNRKELQGQPVFKGVFGPLWNGDHIRYETKDTYKILST
jgi:hypothetical protein